MRIDKIILVNNTIADFDIYVPIDLGTEMMCLIKKDSLISQKNYDVIQIKRTIYLNKLDKDKYNTIYEKYLSTTQKTEYEQKSAIVYSNATNIIDELYHNPETLGGNEKAKEAVDDLVKTILDDDFTIRSLMSIATHDYYTHTHSLNVSVYALSLGAFLKIDKDKLRELGEAALLHDLGKSKIGVEIINKNGKLTDEEFSKMKKHPELGFHLAVNMGIKNKHILHGIRHHHEKMDGSGYPSGLKGESIPFFARIIGLCDIFDALTSKRSYKEAMTTFDALKLIKTKMNNHIDLKILNEMIKMFR